MRELGLLAALSLASFLTAHPANAADAEDKEPPPFGVRLGVRSGYAVPVGKAFEGSGELADTITGYVPVRVDLGARIARHVYLGGLLQLGLLIPKGCGGEVTCSGTNVRVGAMIAYHLLPRRRLDPWVGIGMGYEILNVTRGTRSSDLRFLARGVEVFDVELGIRVLATQRLRFGPVASLSMARFTSITLNGATMNDFSTAIHGWMLFGVAGTYDF